MNISDDCIHVPVGVAHRVMNSSVTLPMVAHWAMASPVPSREWVNDIFLKLDRILDFSNPGDPENIGRHAHAPKYELAPGTTFCDLFAGRFGSVGTCGGYGEFTPGLFTTLPHAQVRRIHHDFTG